MTNNITYMEMNALRDAIDWFRVAADNSETIECGVDRHTGGWNLTTLDQDWDSELQSRHNAYGDEEPLRAQHTAFTQERLAALGRVLHKLELNRLTPSRDEAA